MDWLNALEEWKKKSKTQGESVKSIENIRRCCHIAWSAERIERVKTQQSQRLLIGK